jgi:streptogramin lyase
MYKCVIYIILNFLLLRLNIYAQDIALKNAHIRHIKGEKDGLLYDQFDFIYQDYKGFIWVGNNRALQRYDGIRFKTYFDGTEGTNMSGMGEDKEKNLWLTTHAGCYKFNKQKDKFEKYQDSVKVRGKNFVLLAFNIETDKKGNVWFSCIDFYAVKWANSDTIVCADSILKVKKAQFANFLAIQDSTKIWYGSNDTYAISYYDIEKQKVFNHYHNPYKHSLLDYKFNGFLKFAFDKTGGIWVNNDWYCDILYWTGNNKPIKVLNLKGPILVPRGDGKDQFAPASKMLVDAKNNVYLQFEEHFGIAKYRRETNDFEYLIANRALETGLWDNMSPGYGNGEMFIDKDDNIWYPGDGINIINPNKQIFSNVQGNGLENVVIKNQSNFKGSPLNFIAALNNGRFLGSFSTDGIWEMDQNLNLDKRLRLTQNPNINFASLFSVDGNLVYIQNEDLQLYLYDVSTKSCKVIPKEKFLDFRINDVYVENTKSVWLLNARGGIAHFNPITFEVNTYPFSKFPYGISSRGFNKILPDGKGNLWLSADYQGLHLFDTSKKIIIDSYYANANNPIDLTANSFGTLARYNKDTLVIIGNALLFFDENTKRFSKFSIRDGLPSSRITSAVVDFYNKDLLWVNTYDKAVFIFNVKTKAVTKFSASIGNSMVRGESFCYQNPKNGDLIFSYINGYSKISRNNYLPNIKSETVTISEILVNNTSLSMDSVLSKGTLNLDHFENNLVIKLATLDYWPLSNKTLFRRLGKREDWQKVDANGEVSFLKLPPGKYHFEFAVAENKQSIKNTTAVLNIVIAAPFYQTTWFYLLLIAVFSVLAYLYYRYRLKEVRQQEQVKAKFKQQLTELESMALRSQMNPHFIFNSLNAINRFILKSEKIAASDYLSKFSKLIRNILENSKLQWISLENEIETLQLYLELEAMRFKEKFVFYVKLDDSIEATFIQIPPMIVQPFAENAIWHGLMPSKKRCELHITFSLKNNELICTIADNGIGRPASAKHQLQKIENKTSIGISDTEKRILLMNHSTAQTNVLQIEDMVDEVGNSLGTKVNIKIPFNYI